MSQHMLVELEMPDELANFQLPGGVHERLQTLLDRQDHGEMLTPDERMEADGLVSLTEWLSLLRLRAQRQRHAVGPPAQSPETAGQCCRPRSSCRSRPVPPRAYPRTAGNETCPVGACRLQYSG